ncbi:MAG: CPBP family intramembrane glutamic endopeptidase [Prevotella sp.]|uniref:CPBP family intramembrane glutamic endopeptidase n=1 Tax=Prevotella sp. TaxID=59823 RepID=UPI002A324349|nr:CPBP family intramembrane glutamic endopeptidase [Prevotella sp.]MDD7317209.1 CPBP family intramembrane metalloprotease [Prevotellaceae bacterium]MDY4019813.1 CPBP family intramembrane glutamic endopeptidase [Prevotella sp.]
MKRAIYYLLMFLLVSWIAASATNFIYLLFTGCEVAKALGDEAQRTVPIDVKVGGMVVANIILLVIFLWRRFCPVSRNYMRSRPLKVGLWCVVASLGTILPSIWLQEQLRFLPDLSQSMNGVFGSPLGYLAIVVLVPLCEEVVFRGAVIRSLLEWRNNRRMAVVISAVIFAVAHINPIQIPHAFLLGLLLGWVFVRTDSVIPGIVIHGMNNLVVFLMSWAIPGIDDMTLADLYGGNTLRAALSVLFSLMILVPALYQLHLSMKR